MRKTYQANIPQDMGKELEEAAEKLGLDFQHIVRMLLHKGLQELNRKHKKED